MAGGAVIRQSHFVAVVASFLIGYVVPLTVVGCAGGRSEAPEEQVHTEATASEEARCGGTRTIHLQERTFTTNDVPGCPKGGLLSGTDSRDKLDGKMGDDEIRGLGAKDELIGGSGSDVIYGGDGNDLIDGVDGASVAHPTKVVIPRQKRDELYCGEGEDHYQADKLDYVDSSCEMEDHSPSL